MPTYTILVKPGASSMKTLEFISSNLKSINAMGVRINVHKIDEKCKTTVKLLAKKGIKRLPVLITEKLTIVTGFPAINNLLTKQPSAETRPVAMSMGSSYMDKLIAEECFTRDDNGKLIMKQEPENENNEAMDPNGAKYQIPKTTISQQVTAELAKETPPEDNIIQLEDDTDAGLYEEILQAYRETNC